MNTKRLKNFLKRQPFTYTLFIDQEQSYSTLWMKYMYVTIEYMHMNMMSNKEIKFPCLSAI